MGIDSIKEQIEQETLDIESLFKELDIQRVDFITKIKPFMKDKLKSTVEGEVKRKAEYTKELGIDKLGIMKKQLMDLLEQSDDLIDAIFSNDNLWIHINYSIDFSGDLWGQKRNNVKNAEANIMLGMRKILGKAGKILVEFGYEKAGLKSERSSQWQQEDENEVVYGVNYSFQMPDNIQRTIKGYCSNVEKLHDIFERKEKLMKELSEQEVMDLWEQV